MKRGTPKNKRHLARVAELPCCICERQPVEVHHIRTYPMSSAGRKASDWFSCPLCPDCHAAYHRNPEGWEMQHGAQYRFVEETLEALYG